MLEADVGDDVLGDDPTVVKLQNKAAELLGKSLLFMSLQEQCQHCAKNTAARR